MSRDNVFVIKTLAKSRENHIRISGDLILKGQPTQQVTAEISESKPGDDKPKIKYPPKIHLPGDVRWILPPENSPLYDETKSRVRAAGFQTVEHEDFSYPGK
jgi:hypothetical protein